MKQTTWKILTPLLMTSLLSACAIAPKADDVDSKNATIGSSISAANDAQKAGQTDQALVLLKSAATRFPADKTPWLRIAQIKFDSADYGDAITNALEALQRDPTDKIANSIVTVSGLRLSTKALSDLRSQNALSGTVKSEAQDLAKLLRENLGETVLVPPPTKPAAATPRSRSHATTAKTQRQAKTTPAESEAAPANPFGGLK